MRFQTLDLMADSRRRDKQLPRRDRKAEMAGGNLEGAQRVQRRQTPAELYISVSLSIHKLKKTYVVAMQLNAL